MCNNTDDTSSPDHRAAGSAGSNHPDHRDSACCADHGTCRADRSRSNHPDCSCSRSC